MSTIKAIILTFVAILITLLIFMNFEDFSGFAFVVVLLAVTVLLCIIDDKISNHK